MKISEFSDLTSYHFLSHRFPHAHCSAPTLPSSSVGHTSVLLFCSSSCLYLDHSDSGFHVACLVVFSCICSSIIFSLRPLRTSPEASALQDDACPSKGSPSPYLIISRLVSRVGSQHSADREIWSDI